MTDVDTAGQAGTVTSPRPFDSFKAYLARRAEQSSATRSHDVAASQIDRMLAAAETGDEAELWDADEGGTVAAKDFLGIEIGITSFDVIPGNDEFDTPLGVYVLIHAYRLDTPDVEVLVNTGAPAVITKLLLFEQKGYMKDGRPLECFFKGTGASAGRTVVKLRPIPQRATRAAAE